MDSRRLELATRCSNHLLPPVAKDEVKERYARIAASLQFIEDIEEAAIELNLSMLQLWKGDHLVIKPKMTSSPLTMKNSFLGRSENRTTTPTPRSATPRLDKSGVLPTHEDEGGPTVSEHDASKTQQGTTENTSRNVSMTKSQRTEFSHGAGGVSQYSKENLGSYLNTAVPNTANMKYTRLNRSALEEKSPRRLNYGADDRHLGPHKNPRVPELSPWQNKVGNERRNYEKR
jgi:hypothetical protein